MTTSRVQTQANTPFADAAVNAELRDYHLHERIRQDELATVYAATHLTLERPVEVHILRRPDWVSGSRFQLAARLGARLNHPNLLPVQDAGHDEQYGDYMVTPLLDAQTLAHALADAEPLDPVQALRIVSQVAAALDYLHSQQIFHRDVQPGNILLTRQGTVYLTSLSLAASPDTPDLSSVDEADYLTSYSAPEQHLDQSEASPALDIYSLGAVCYHMLSGEVPPAPGLEISPLTRQHPSFDNVDLVLQRMMAVEPETRFASAGESVIALRRALRLHIDQSTDDMEESRWEPVAEWLDNPLEIVLGSVLQEQEETREGLTDDATSTEALHDFQAYLSDSHTRADVLHRGDTIRRLLNRWSRKGMFRRPALGQVIQLEQVVSYNIYFYELRTLYETRTPLEKRRRMLEPDDHQDTAPMPGLWEVDVPEPPPFSPVKPQELVMPNSTHVFICPACDGGARVACPTCNGTGTVERQRRARSAPVEEAQQTIPEKCSTCHGYGEVQCPDCGGNGNLVEEQVFTWSRRARLWQNTDDIEGLPRLALEQRARPVCKALINPYQGYWHSVAPLNELLRAAIDQMQDANTHIIAAELQISGVPITEIDYQLNEKAQRLYLIGHDNEVVGNWLLLNPDRIALVVVGIAAVLAVVVFVVAVLLL